MLKKTILALAAAVITSQAFAHDLQNGRDGNRPWHLFEGPGSVVVQPGQAAVIQVAPQVVYAPAPQPDYSNYSQPTGYSQDDCPPPVFISQPAQTARLRY
jgi:hypothetical protein